MSLLLSQLGGAAATPNISNGDWPVPTGATPALLLRTWINQALATPFAPPTLNFDWPNPREAQRTNTLLSWLQSPAPPTPLPPINYDWPLPRGVAQPSDLRTYLNSVNLSLLGKDQFGARQLDWPVPQAQQRSTYLLSWIQFYQPPAPTVALPFNNYVWPNPLSTQRVVELLSWIGTCLLPLPMPCGNYFGWRNPTTITTPRRLDFRQDWIKFDPAAVPTLTYDWPNPPLPARSIELLTWIYQLSLVLLGQDQFFGLAGNPQFDWPNPRGAAPSLDLLTMLSTVQPPAPTPVQAQAVYSRHFFATVGSLMDTPGNPSS